MMSRCLTCQGSGQIMGGGMIIKDCVECKGVGKISSAPVDDGIDLLAMKQTESYNSAVKRVAAQANISLEAAGKLLDAGFENDLVNDQDAKFACEQQVTNVSVEETFAAKEIPKYKRGRPKREVANG